MPQVRCLICRNEALLAFANNALNQGISGSGIAAAMTDAGAKLDPDVVNRHKNNHWIKPVDPAAPKATHRDLAIMVRDKVADAIEKKDPETMLYFGKEMAPFVNAGLKAQGILDKRAAVDRKLGLAEGALGFQMYLAGLGKPGGMPDAPAIEDGKTIDGEAVEVGPSQET